MSSTAITAQGIAIARFGTTTFETIPNVVSFQGPGGQASVIDVTNLASTATLQPRRRSAPGIAHRPRQPHPSPVSDHLHRCGSRYLDFLRLCHAVQRARRRGRGGRGQCDH
jgi:hypothetical protein